MRIAGVPCIERCEVVLDVEPLLVFPVRVDGAEGGVPFDAVGVEPFDAVTEGCGDFDWSDRQAVEEVNVEEWD